jgi:hypothetical protein
MSMSTILTYSLQSTLSSALDLVTATSPLSYSQRLVLDSGNGSGEANLQWSDTRTIAASANEDLDLAGSLTAPLGGTLTIVKLKLLLIHAATGNTNNVRVTRPASNGVPWLLAASDGFDIPPGGTALFVGPASAGLATVTAGTGDLINVANSSSGTSVTYDVIVLGTSA